MSAEHFRLTKREKEIVRLAARGLDIAAIGATLNLTGNTVRNHLQRVRQKAGVRNMLQLVLWAQKNGILEEEDGGPGAAVSAC